VGLKRDEGQRAVQRAALTACPAVAGLWVGPLLACSTCWSASAEQPGVWRRIGDGALFLAGVLPEYAQRLSAWGEMARLSRLPDSNP
jgi:hypothetical protein